MATAILSDKVLTIPAAVCCSKASQSFLRWQDLGITGKYIIRDLWRQKDLETFEDSFKADVPRHGVVLVSLRPAK